MATPRADGDDQPVRVIGRYELVSVIAPGAFGELWKARIVSGPEQGRIVSIRRVPRTGAFEARAIELLTNAGFAAMEVRHPKIGAVLDVVVADSEIALVSEHIGGALLTTVLRPTTGKRPNVSTDVALRIVLDVLEAVDAVHAQWRDLYPSADSDNDRLLGAAAHGGLVPDSVLLASFGEAMLLDAGLAGIAMTMPPILEHADVIAYRAPEQLEGGGLADERSDVFTVGVLAWELLAGRPLFAPAVMPRPATTGPAAKTKAFSDAMQVSTVKRKVLTATIQRLDSLPLLRGKVTKAFSDLVAKCLERDPAKRFQSVRELIGAITGLGPRTVASYDAVSKLLASVGGAAPAPESPNEPSSSRTSNRPTVPPEKGANKDSVPPDTKRAPAAGAVMATSLDVTPERTKVETLSEEDRRTAPGDSLDEALSEADFQSIPPTTGSESLAPSTDVESLPPSADSRLTPPVVSDAISVDAPSFFPPSPSTDKRPTDHDPLPFAPVLAPPPIGDSRSEEPTSAPVVRPLSDDGGVDLASTLMSSKSGGGGSKKIVIGVVAAAGVLALIGIIRAATSGNSVEPTPLSASAAASTTPPSPPAVEPPAPSATAEPAEPAEAPEPAEPPTAKASPPPTSAPTLSPTGVPLKRLPPPLPAKKKPFRPSGI